jgi:CRISPR-associated protein Csh1
MLESLKQLGELFGRFKPYDTIEGDFVLVLNLDDKGNFLNFELEDFSKEKLDKYFYKDSGASNPPSWTPTLNLNPKEPQKTLRNAIKRLEVLADFGNLQFENLENLNVEKLAETLKETLKEIPSKKKVIFTVKINGKYIGEIEELKEGLKKFLEHRFSEKIDSSEGVCSICKERKRVFGKDIFPIKFYNLDKPHFIHGGFKRKEFVFPVCYECSLKLKEGWNFVVRNLTFNFAGKIKFHLIPELVIEDKEKLKWLIEKRLLKTAKKVDGLSKEAKDKLAQDERRILKKISEEKNYFTVHLLFLKKKNKEERINLYLYGIYPSRLKELFEFKTYIDKLLEINFNYSTVLDFFKEDYQKEFYEYTRSTFKGVPFNKVLLLKILLEKLKQLLNEKEGLNTFERDLKKALGVYLFSLLTSGGLNMEGKNPNCLEVSQTLEEFLDCFSLLRGSAERGLFLLGVLTGKLLKIQEGRLDGNKPFLKKLKGLKMHKKDFKNLFTEVVAKLEEYDQASDYRVLTKKVEKVIEKTAQYLLSSQDWKLSDKEANFIFACGMGLSQKVFDFIDKASSKKDKNQGG